MPSRERLAIQGGEPVRRKPWPRWPRADENTEQALRNVLYSGRWTFSGFYHGSKCYEKKFASAFAEYNGSRFCIPVANGTSALMTALQALGIGAGDEVLVPGVTWVACASAVVAVGAIPVLVDIDSETLCMSVSAARKAVTSRTAAIMLVHLYCTIADLDAFTALAAEMEIPLIEDCSQAHGAVWRSCRVGTFGKVGTFSMQHSKVLTCGEGGAVITDDPELKDRMEQLRADGRRYTEPPPQIGFMELEEVGDVLGQNRCLSEFHAAILLDRLVHLDAENTCRERNAQLLTELLERTGGVSMLRRDSRADRVTIYQFCGRIDKCSFQNTRIENICHALSAELGFLVEPIDTPLNTNKLYVPLRSRLRLLDDDDVSRSDSKQYELPCATQAREECFVFSHHVLLAEEGDMSDISEAFAKVMRLSAQLVSS